MLPPHGLGSHGSVSVYIKQKQCSGQIGLRQSFDLADRVSFISQRDYYSISGV